MMRQKIAWFLLVSYTAIHLLLYGSFAINPIALLIFDGEPLIVSLFYLMGLFPLFFLMVFLYGPKPYKTRAIIFHALGFMFGAFALLLIVPLEKTTFSIPTKKIRLVIGGCALTAFALITYGVLMGSFSSLSLSESLIHIMTIDFIILYVMSVIVAKKRFNRWPLAFIPVVGALALLAITKKENT